MAESKIENTLIVKKETYKEIHQRRGLFIFSWWVKIKSDSISKDLIIETAEKYDSIILNGRELVFKEDKGIWDKNFKIYGLTAKDIIRIIRYFDERNIRLPLKNNEKNNEEKN